MTRAYLSLGANLGDRLEQLTQALQRLGAEPETALVRVSGVYETEPQGKVDQPQFLNCAVCLETGLAPDQLLAATSRIEAELGRQRHERWGPRTIDIDILLYGAERLDEPELTIPHPRMQERAFVLIPLLEVFAADSPAARIQGELLKEMLAALPDQGVRLYTDGASIFQCVRGVE